MKKIFRIARLELSVMIYSPIAWLILIIFIIQCSSTFMGLIEAKETNQQLGYGVTNLTKGIFGGSYGFFSIIQHQLYLYIPLLTMGLMSRELNNGSIKLLYSSPVTIKEIILGKFSSMVVFCFVLMSVLFAILLVAYFTIDNLDVPFILGGILGLYLLILAYSAIGVFISTLTPYLVVAGISTLALLSGLKYVSTIGKGIDFVRDITYWLTIEGRANNFINGLIGSKDVMYFLLIITLFLGLSIMYLNNGRKNESSSKIASTYGVFVVLIIAVGYLSSLPSFSGYYDTTRFESRTLTSESQKLIAQVTKPIKITTYSNVNQLSFARYASPKWRNFDLKQFDDFRRFLPAMKMEYQPHYNYSRDAYDKRGKTIQERAKNSSLAYGFEFNNILSPEELKKVIDLKDETNGFVRKLEYNGKSTSLRMFYDQFVYPHEAEISAGLKRLLTTIPVIGVLEGHDEREIYSLGDKGYNKMLTTYSSRKSLINQGFDIVKIPIDTVEIPLDLTVLVIANPLRKYDSIALGKIKNYIQSGGNIIISTEPGKQHELNPLIEDLGVAYNSGILLQETTDFALDLVQAKLNKEARTFGFKQIQKDIITMYGTVGISYSKISEFETIPLLTTRKVKVWNQLGNINLETDVLSFEDKLDSIQTYTVAVALTRKLKSKQQKIVILGDSDYMSNAELKRKNVTNKNFSFTTQLFKWFSGGEYPIDVSRPKPVDNKILVSRQTLSWLKLFLSGILPGVLLVLGTTLLILRKRK